MKCRILISDYDDTLIDDDGNLPEVNREAIAKFKAAGGIFAVNTGRMINSILPIVKRLNIGDYLGCYQGGVIADTETGNIMRDVRLSADETVRQLRELESVPGRHIHLYDMDKLYVSEKSPTLSHYEKISGVSAAVTGEKLSEFAERNGIAANKLMLIAEMAEVQAERLRLMSKYPQLVFVLSKPTFLEVTPQGGTKGAFVDFMAKKFGVGTDEIAAVGDSLNDTDMIERAGLGAAVANANPDLKAAANLVLERTNNDGAVAELIEKILKE